MAKKLLFVIFLVVAAAAAVANADLLGGLLGILGGFNITGTVGCNVNGTVNPTANPPQQVFPNAVVQLVCGGKLVTSAITNELGTFSMVLGPISSLLTSLLSDCNAVVATPLSSCNASLPSNAVLTSPLRLVQSTVQGLLTILNFVPSGFLMNIL